MTIRTILAAISGGAASEGAIATACSLTQRFGAHLEALHVKVDPVDILPVFGVGVGIGVPMYGDLVRLTTEQATAAAMNARQIFEAAITRHALAMRSSPAAADPAAPGDVSAAWREEVGLASARVPRRARFFDLTVLGRSGRVGDIPCTDTLEQTLLEGGRPVLVAPFRPGSPVGETVAVAWADSASAARAVANAMPFLRRARSVHVITAGKSGACPNEELAEYFAWHKIAAVSHLVAQVEGAATGELLITAARDCGADLLVMGGYGHALWREALFGGVSRDVLATARLPILITH